MTGKGEWLSEHAQTIDCDSMSAWTSKVRPGGGGLAYYDSQSPLFVTCDKRGF